MNTERYRCLSCGHMYKGAPGPTECPACGHLYVKWESYEENFGEDAKRWRRKKS